MSLMMANLDSIVFVGFPLLGLLICMLLRADAVASNRLKPVALRRQAAGQDRNGRPRCVDPDGKSFERVRRDV